MKLKLKEVLALNCVVFSLVFIAHIFRLGNRWEAIISTYTVPQGVSIFAIILAGFLLYNNYTHFKKQK